MRRRRGSMLMEAVLVLPVLVMLIFAILQFAHLMMVQQVVEYAAYCGARATLTSNSAISLLSGAPRKAVLRVLAPVALAQADDTAERGPHAYPGWGALKGTKDFDKRVEVSFVPHPLYADTLRHVACTVKYKYPLLVPIPFYRTTNGVVRLEGKAVLPFRYSTRRYPQRIAP